jgi:outer membrane protein TolC
LLAAGKTLALTKAQVEAAQSAFILARAQAGIGTALFQEVLASQSELDSAKEAYDAAMAQADQAQVALMFATGRTLSMAPS